MTDYPLAEVENVMRIVDKVVLARWSGHRDVDDIRAEGYYQAWQGYQRAKARGTYKPTTRVFHEARHAAAAWFRQQERWTTEPLDEDRLGSRGPEAQVLARLEWREWLALLPERERWLLRRRYADQWTKTDCARALSRSPERIDQLERQALDRIRRHLGLLSPPADDPGRARLSPFCRVGHAFTAANTYRSPRGERHCILCRQSARRAYRQRLKEKCSCP